MRVAVVVLLAVLSSAVGRTLWHQLDASYTFDKYCAEFGRSYAAGSQEYATRQALFESNLAAVRAHNQDPARTWKEGVNQYTDRTREEFTQLLGYNKAVGYTRRAAKEQVATAPAPPTDEEAQLALSGLPTSVDWRLKNAVTAVKDQGQCGSCWTFASSETMESAWFLKTGLLEDLSEQQIASCTSNPKHCGGSGGCEGGTAEVAYASIITAGGLESEWTYPYTSYTGTDSACQVAAGTKFAANITSYVSLPSNQALPFMNALAAIGPIAITVAASSWQPYESGVYNGCNQSDPDLDHNVQAVGYGTDSLLGDYWLVRNSWSAAWGESGYIRVARGNPSTPECGTDTTPSDGSGCDDGPATVTVCGTCGILFDNVYPVV